MWLVIWLVGVILVIGAQSLFHFCDEEIEVFAVALCWPAILFIAIFMAFICVPAVIAVEVIGKVILKYWR